ncbi:MAG TPA: AtpZ/AtpI family protein [Saprospiraceae bacterium]|nr:AtpZ/AtpI family protein [Saprospiraceae bacterium]
MQQRKLFRSSTILARYSGMALELFIFLMILFYLGKKLDSLLSNKKPFLAIAAMVLGLTGYLYKVYRDSSIKNIK